MFYTHDGGVIWHRDRPAELAIPISVPSASQDDEVAQPVRELGRDLARFKSSSMGSGDRSPMRVEVRPEAEEKAAPAGPTYDQFGFPIDPAGETRLGGNGAVRTVALSTTMTQIIGPSQQRVALLFSPPTTAGQSYTVTTEPGASLGAGLNVTSTTGPLRLTEEVFGDAVTRPWFAAASSAFSIGVLETIVVEKL